MFLLHTKKKKNQMFEGTNKIFPGNNNHTDSNSQFLKQVYTGICVMLCQPAFMKDLVLCLIDIIVTE